MVVIRLAPFGRKNAPVYKITVQGKGAKLTGKFLEKIGNYIPSKTNPKFEMNVERYSHWVKLGAQPSARLKKLVKDNVKLAPAATEAKVDAKAAPAKEKAAKAAPKAKAPKKA
jgi:small subunit ribosomal protein S16